MTTLHMVGKRTEDDFGQPIHRTEGEVLYDAATTHGPWALMTEASYLHHRRYKELGTGRGQKYRLDETGRYVKVEG